MLEVKGGNSVYEDFMLDAGHGGSDPGAVGPTGLQEKDINLRIIKRLGAKLTAQGVKVAYTRTGDNYVGLSGRARAANALKAVNFLSIHCNGFKDPAATGTETVAYAAGGNGQKLANAIQKRLVAATGRANRGVKFQNLAVLRETTMPAALAEVVFITNPQEEALLKLDSFIEKVAHAIFLGCLDYLGRTYTEPEPIAEPTKGVEIMLPVLIAFNPGGDGSDARAAQLLHDKLGAPIINRDFVTPDMQKAFTQVIEVGGAQKLQGSKLVSGNDRYDTYVAVLQHIGKVK